MGSNQWPSVAIRGRCRRREGGTHRGQSVAIRGNQWPSVAIRGTHHGRDAPPRCELFRDTREMGTESAASDHFVTQPTHSPAGKGRAMVSTCMLRSDHFATQPVDSPRRGAQGLLSMQSSRQSACNRRGNQHAIVEAPRRGPQGLLGLSSRRRRRVPRTEPPAESACAASGALASGAYLRARVMAPW